MCCSNLGCVPYTITATEQLCLFSRKLIRQKLLPHEIPVTFTSFPRLGVKDVFLDPHHEPLGEASQSLFLPDQIINPHVRFPYVCYLRRLVQMVDCIMTSEH